MKIVEKGKRVVNGKVVETLDFSTVSGNKLFFTFEKKCLFLKGKNYGAMS